ncbi:MAG: hypothetical protein ONB23_07475 [candidate division KSB1 bacterium]|nr:hypothetical protein [candidate division KSB1 bacterium]
MRKSLCVVACAAMIAVAASVSLGQERCTLMGVFYGGSEPWQEAGSYYDHDYYLFGVSAGVDNLAVSKVGALGLRVDLGYIPWKMKSGRSDYKSTILMLAFRGAYAFPIFLEGKVRLAPTVGVGFYPISYSVPAGEEEPDSQAKAGVNFGGELSYRATEKLILTLGAIHHIVFTDYVGQVGGRKIEGETPFTVVSLTASYALPSR